MLHSLGTWASKASAGVTVAGVLLAWGVLGAFTAFPHWWEISLYSSTSAVTVVMLFAVQHTQHREQVVTQRKLDELLRAQPGADDLLIAAESAGDAELEALVDLRPDDPRTQALAAALRAEDGVGD